jgi:hypothetical protein
LGLASKQAAVALIVLAAGACRRADHGAGAPRAAAGTPSAAPSPPPPAPRGRQISLLYASDLGASYETCGCPVHPMGGLARRATQTDRARAEADATLVVDAGDLFLPPAHWMKGQPPPDPGEVERRARLLAAAYRRIGTTAMTPGERDLALGLPLYTRVTKQAKLPVVSANLRGRDGRLLFDADRLVDAAGVKVGVFGVTAPPTPEDAAAWKAAGIDAADPAAAARERVAALRARGAGIVVALVHVGLPDEDRRLLRAVPGIDWAVIGHSALRFETPESVDGTRMLGVLAEGKELGRLDLHLVGGGLAFVDRGARAELETILADHRRQLVDYDRRLGETDPASLRDYYESRHRDLEKAIVRETEALARLPRAIAGSWFENTLIPLDAATPDQTGVGLLVSAYNRESEQRAAAGKPVGVGPMPAARPAPDPAAANGYLGTAACGACHAPALAFWKTSKHARALSALARVGRDHDPSCVGCHVTGYLQPGGWTLATKGPARTDDRRSMAELANVSCEDCHGPGSAHVAAIDKKTGTSRAVPKSVCLGCHTPDITEGELDDPRFREAILGPGHGKPTGALAPGPRPPL